jgi:ubiquinone/menaquinone biosynthesis C-methylase UbiE
VNPHRPAPGGYVHGRSRRESERLQDQASALADLLHDDTHYPPGSRVLEAGCGVGAQTRILARRSPEAFFTSVDISADAMEKAREAIAREGLANVTFRQADIFRLPFGRESFDHVFVCFLLEHLTDPVKALRCIKEVLKMGGTITVIEGDHGSAFFHPDSREARQAIGCLVEIQRRMGGNALTGRELFHLMHDAGFASVRVSPRFVYADGNRPDLVEGFTRNTFTAMVEGVAEKVQELDLMDPAAWQRGIRDLYRTAGPGGTFCYTFFKATGVKEKE